ncbi:MAG: hypothetical protein GC159_19090 [Phycisphaera sp.]|nr:hypothetical protein [Phycisphaera sp.]
MPDTRPTQPLDHPAAWVGDELLRRDDWLVRLGADDVAELDAATRALGDLHVDHDTAAFTAERFALPTLAPRLAKIQHNLEHGSGAVMLRGLPVIHDELYARRLFFGLASHIGAAVTQSAAGERVFSVRDAGYAEGDARARGPNTARKLSFHTDRCDVIAFMCLRQAKSGGDNLLVSSMTLFNRLLDTRPDLLDVLMQPVLYKRHNVDTANPLPYCRQPIMSFTEGHFACGYLRVLIDRAYAEPDTPAMTDAQREAMDTLEQLAEDPSLHVRFAQQPGDVLLLNNWVTLHRRDAFEDHEDAALKRHILRIWLSMPNSRPLHALFKDNYGAVEAGAIRGGMPKA